MERWSSYCGGAQEDSDARRGDMNRTKVIEGPQDFMGYHEYGPHDWIEDHNHENGNYIRECTTCGKMFVGHKRRITCKICAGNAKAEGGEG